MNIYIFYLLIKYKNKFLIMNKKKLHYINNKLQMKKKNLPFLNKIKNDTVKNIYNFRKKKQF